jgi:flagellar protein FlbD
MILLTRLNSEPVLINSDLIVTAEANPDTVIALTTGERIRVRESLAEISSLVVGFRRQISGQAAERRQMNREVKPGDGEANQISPY